MALWKEKFIGVNKYTRSGKKLTAVKKIVIHWTANNGGTASNHFTYFNTSLIAQNMKLPESKRRYASAHFFVDSIESLLLIPLNEVAFHANDGSTRKIPELRPNANLLSIGIEMCVEKNGTFHPKTIERAEDIAVELCRRYKLNPLTDIVRHYDITGKNCPAPWVSNGQLFTDFKNRVNAKFRGVQPAQPATPTPPTNTTPNQSESTKVDGVIEVLVSNLNLRSDASFNAPIIRTLPKGSKWKVYALKNGLYNLGGNQWCSAGTQYVKFTPASSTSQPQPTPQTQPQPAPQAEPKAIGTVEVIVGALNLRQSSNLQSKVLRVLKKGETYKVWGKHNNMYDLGGGWVSASSQYVKFTPNSTQRVQITASALNIRANNNLSSKIVGVALKGQTFPIYETSNGMYKIGEGKWISASSSYVKKV